MNRPLRPYTFVRLFFLAFTAVIGLGGCTDDKDSDESKANAIYQSVVVRQDLTTGNIFAEATFKHGCPRGKLVDLDDSQKVVFQGRELSKQGGAALGTSYGLELTGQGHTPVEDGFDFEWHTGDKVFRNTLPGLQLDIDSVPTTLSRSAMTDLNRVFEKLGLGDSVELSLVQSSLDGQVSAQLVSNRGSEGFDFRIASRRPRLERRQVEGARAQTDGVPKLVDGPVALQIRVYQRGSLASVQRAGGEYRIQTDFEPIVVTLIP